jgi:hypothetical protein
MHSGKGVLWATAKSSTSWSDRVEGEAGTMHISNLLHCAYIYVHGQIYTSSGARTTAGWEAGAERLRPAENLEDAAERSWKTAAEGLDPTGGLEAAAEYEMAEEVATLQEGSESSATAGLEAGSSAFE